MPSVGEGTSDVGMSLVIGAWIVGLSFEDAPGMSLHRTTVLSKRIEYSHLLFGEMPTRRAPKRLSDGGRSTDRERRLGWEGVPASRSWKSRTPVDVDAMMYVPSSDMLAD